MIDDTTDFEEAETISDPVTPGKSTTFKNSMPYSAA